MYAVKVYIRFKHRVDRKRPCSRVLRHTHFAHTLHLRLLFERKDFVSHLVAVCKAYAVDFARGIVKHKLDERQRLASRLWIIRIVAFVFVGFLLYSEDFSAKDDVFASGFYVYYVVWQLRYALDLSASVYFVAHSRVHKSH